MKKPWLSEKVREYRKLQEYRRRLAEIRKLKEGGPGSGFFGHAGRPGQVGGSSSDGGGAEASPRDKEFAGEKIGKGAFSGKTSMDTHKDVQGNWTVERKTVHSEAHKAVFGNATPVDNPIVIFTGGGTASGKSRLVRDVIAGEIPENIVKIDPDKIKQSLPDYVEKLKAGDKDASPYVHDEASYLTKEFIKEAGEGKYNILVDTTGTGSLEELSRKLDALRAGGAKIIAHYTTCPIEMAMARSVERVTKGTQAHNIGRVVAESDVRLAHQNVSRLLPEAIKRGLFDEVSIWDTRQKPETKIASAKGSELTIHNQEWWQEFLDKGK